VFPLTLSAVACLLFGVMFKSAFIKMLVVAAGFVWSTRASVVFMQQIISEERKLLAVYPVFMFYTFLAWMILVL
jgi:protein YIPF6